MKIISPQLLSLYIVCSIEDFVKGFEVKFSRNLDNSKEFLEYAVNNIQ